MSRIVLSIIAAVSLAASSAADEPKKVALLVGVNEYDKRGFRPLAFAERDVDELAKVLTRSGYDVTTLTGDRDDDRRATLANIKTHLNHALTGRNQVDMVLIGFAGHGFQIDVDVGGGVRQSDSFFCPVDAERGNTDTMFSIGKLLEELDLRGGGTNLLLVDACREDPTRGRGLDGSTVKTLPEGVAVLFGCRAGQKTFETPNAGGGHGVFFHFVIEGLGGKAVNDRGEVTWSRLAEYVVERVQTETPTLLNDDSASQVPNDLRNLPGVTPVLVRVKSTKAGGGYLGVTVNVVPEAVARTAGLEKSQGAYVVYCIPGSPSRLIGLQTGDVILRIDDQIIANDDGLVNSLATHSAGEQIQLMIARGEKRLSLQATLGSFPSLRERMSVIRKDAEQGSAAAAYELANKYERGGDGVPPDIAEALRWWQRAAEAGHPIAARKLGEIYYFGEGVTRDAEQAFLWFLKAGELGNVDAQCNLGIMLSDGKDYQEDYPRALEWFRKAADQGNAQAEYNIGFFYANGQGVKANRAKAIEYLSKAAQKGDDAAKDALRDLGVSQ